MRGKARAYFFAAFILWGSAITIIIAGFPESELAPYYVVIAGILLVTAISFFLGEYWNRLGR